MDAGSFALVLTCVFLWAVLSAKAERAYLSAPIVFVAVGWLLAAGLDLLHPGHEAVKVVSETTLVWVLFADASTVQISKLRRDAVLYARLLGVGLPLTVGLGTVAAIVLLDMEPWTALLVGAALAPTDAALGAAVMTDPHVPAQRRRLLNVESGLNDGIATPFVGIFLAGAAATEAVHGASGVGSAFIDLAGGAAMGLAIGLVAAVLMRLAAERGYSAPAFRPLTPLAVALLAYAATVQVGANGFIAAFVAGLAFGSTLPSDLEPTIEFTNVVGEVLSLLMWFLVGATMLVPALQDAQWEDAAFAVLALTLVRMVPVAIACLGLGLDRRTVAFIGWFGPRGLASVIFALLAFDTLEAADGRRVLAAVTITVVVSVVAHGVTASPLAARYGAAAATFDAHRAEHVPTPEMAPRMLPNRAGARPRPGAPEPGQDG